MVVTKRPSWRTLTLVVVAAITLAACGSSKTESGGDTRKVVKIGMIVPLLSGSTAVGIGIRNSVDLAIRQANDKNAVPGWRIDLAAEDDSGKPDVGGRAATKLATDNAVAAVIGTYNSSVALQTIPILDNASIAQVSPANSSDALTKGENLASPVRPHKNYFRTATVDSLQGGFGADYAYNTANARNVVIIHDNKTYGKGLAESFQARFVKDGGTVLGEVRVIGEEVTDYSSDVTNILPLNPDLIFYGGEYTAAARLTTELKKQGVTAPLMGGDGIVDQTYVDNAKDASKGDLGTSFGAPAEQLPSAKSYLDSYNAASYRDPPSAYGALAFDAANVVIGALTKVLAGKDKVDVDVRKAVIDAIQATSFDGATGKVAFDQYGDTVTKLLTVYQVADNAWKPIKTGEFAG
ncbi:MAG: branched-chain amino acid transport system substrate-binding protein [Actinomycetota bacterium]|jgi:branched-chain amino acid transport system substrate-binding protein|nr:branched-chain amino acid transport system substrate-binding protein [Actinomycetota bacterium]